MALRRQLARLKKLLLARDVSLVVQGVEFVAALDDDNVWHALLDGVTYADERRSRNGLRSMGPGLVPNALFTGTAPAQPYHDLALVLLVARSPLAGLKAGIRALALWSRNLHAQREVWLPTLVLDGLEGLHALETLEIETSRVIPSLAPLGCCPALRRLVIKGTGQLDDLDGLGASTSLRELVITVGLGTTAGIAGAPLASLHVDSGPLRDLRDLDDTTVAEVEIVGASALDLADLARCPELRTLTLVRCNVVASTPVRPEDRSDALVSVCLRVVAAPDLAFVRYARALRTLILDDCTVDDTSALGDLDGLERLSLRRLRTRRLDRLPPAMLVDQVGAPTDQLTLLPPLRSVRGVGRLQGLRILCLAGCTDLDGLEGLEDSSVVVLDLRRCTRLMRIDALERMPALRMVALTGTPVRGHDVLERIRWAVTWSDTLDLRAGLDRPRPAGRGRRAPVPVPEDQRAAWEGLLPRLAIAAPEDVDALVDHLAQQATPEIFDALLKDVFCTPGGWSVPRGPLARSRAGLGSLVIQRIVGVATGAVAANLARMPTALTLRPAHAGAARAGPVDLRGLERLGGLTALTVEAASSLVGLEGSSALGGLVRLVVHGPVPLDDLGPMAALQHLDASGSETTRLDFARAAPELRSLSVSGRALRDISGLVDHPRLERLRLTDVTGVADLSPLATLRALASLELDATGPLPSLARLHGLRSVSLGPRGWADAACLADLPSAELTLAIREPTQLTGLEDLPRLDVLSIQATAPVSLHGLPRRLRRLRLTGAAIDPATLPSMALDALELAVVRDLSFVERLEGLHTLAIEGHALVDLSPLAAAASLASLHIAPHEHTSLAGLRDHPTLARIVVPAFLQQYLDAPRSVARLICAPEDDGA